MLEAADAYRRAGLDFPRHAVAVTGEGSELDDVAAQGRLARALPDVGLGGGRTSELSAVGLLPAALQGLDMDGLLAGAAACDEATRVAEVAKNPAALLALAWYRGDGRTAQKDMVVLPYKDRLLLFSRYLQQLVMESLGKEKDLAGNVVHQGIAVYGNKGSTDQHAYVQQLREGVPNFFVTFIEVASDRENGARVARRRARRHARATTSTAFSSARGRRSTRTGAARSRSRFRTSPRAPSARSSRSTSARSASTRSSSASTRTTSPASRPGRRPPPRSSPCRARILADLRREEGRASGRPRSIAASLGATEEIETVFAVLATSPRIPTTPSRARTGRRISSRRSGSDEAVARLHVSGHATHEGRSQGLRLATSASKSFPAAATLRRGPVSLKNTAPFGPSAIAPAERISRSSPPARRPCPFPRSTFPRPSRA